MIIFEKFRIEQMWSVEETCLQQQVMDKIGIELERVELGKNC